MGLSNIPSLSEGVLPVFVLNTVVWMAMLFNNMLRCVLQLAVSTVTQTTETQEESDDEEAMSSRRGRVSITQYKNISTTSDVVGSTTLMECCVCLCVFEPNEEVSELPCNHIFHTPCLNKWFLNTHTTCPLCRRSTH